MICKTEAIVLRTQRFQENSLIVTLYSREFGRFAAIVPGVYSTKGRSRHALFQVMNVVELIFYRKETRELQKITDSHYAVLYQTLNIEPVKSLYGATVIEIFYRCVREENDANPNLYAFLRETLQRLDQTQRYLYNALVYYMVHLMGHLGFYPNLNVEYPFGNIHLDYARDEFRNVDFPTPIAERLLFQFAGVGSYSMTENIVVPPAERKAVLNTLFRYYNRHIPDFQPPNTLSVFEELFARD